MSQWEEKLNDHPIHATLANLGDRLSDKGLKTDDANILELVDRIAQLKKYTEICLANVITPLISLAHLNNANSQLQNVLNELNSFVSNKNVGHLNNASNHVDAVMNQIRSLPVPQNAIADVSFTEALTQFKSLAEQSFTEIKKFKDELKNSFAEISNDAENQKTKIESLSAKIDQYEKDIVTSIDNFKIQQKEISQNFNEKFNTVVKTHEDEWSELMGSQENEHKSLLNSHDSNASKMINIMEEKKQKASDLLQIIGNIGTTGNYQKIANQEKKSADRWRNIALILMIGMVCIIGLTIGITANNGFDWKLALFRIGAALVLAIPATYAAKESSRHRTVENHNRRAELEIASLDPFLEKLPDEIKNKVKENLTERFFGLNNTPEAEKAEAVSYSALFDLLKTAISKS